MISRDDIRKSLKPLASVIFILLCCSIGAFAQSAPVTQESKQSAKAFSFTEASLKAAINAIGSQLNLNVVFDDSVRDDKISLDLKDVTAKQVMKIILIQKKLQARTIEENTIIVFPDNEQNRRRYSEYELWPAKTDTSK